MKSVNRSTRPLNLLIVSRGVYAIPPRSSGGGAELHAFRLAEALARQGDWVILVSRTRDHLITDAHLKITKIVLNRPYLGTDIGFLGWVLKHAFGAVFSVIAAVKEIRKDRSIEIVHCHSSLSSLMLLPLRNRRKIVYTIHDLTPWQSNYASRIERTIRKTSFLLVDRLVWKKADSLIAVSEALQAELSRFGVDEQRCTTIPNGVNMQPYESSARDSLGTTFGLFVGQVAVRKGIGLLCDAIKDIDTKILIAGDGPHLEATKKLVLKLGLEEKIILSGYVSRDALVKLYESASYFVMPSLSDAFPTLAMLEAMSHGLPIICSDLATDSDLVVDGITARVFKRGNSAELSEAILKICQDRKARRALGINARTLVKKRCSWSSVALATHQVYEKTISRA